MSWTPHRLDQLGDLARGRSRHRPRDAAHLYGGPYPFVQTGDVKHAGLYILDYSQAYSESGLEQSKLWPTGTLCITIAANIADTAILGFDACFPDSIIGFIPFKGKADARFVKYLFDATIQQHVKQFAQGAAQDNLSQEKLLSFEFLVPDVADQRKIADKLSAYDDLIQANLRRISLLEEAARLIYREWFVHLRFPGHERVRVVDGVPEGWERVELGQVITLNYGKALRSEDRLHGSSPVFGSSGIVGTHSKALTEGPCIILGRKGNVGSVFWSPAECWPIDTVFFVSQIEADLYLFHALQEMPFINSDAAVPGLNRNAAYRLPVLLPKDGAREQFNEIANSPQGMIANLIQQNAKLSAARDLLLPRLMSGALEV